MLFLLGYNLKIVIQWEKLTFGGGIFPGGRGEWANFQLVGGTPPIPPVGKTLHIYIYVCIIIIIIHNIIMNLGDPQGQWVACVQAPHLLQFSSYFHLMFLRGVAFKQLQIWDLPEGITEDIHQKIPRFLTLPIFFLKSMTSRKKTIFCIKFQGPESL